MTEFQIQSAIWWQIEAAASYKEAIYHQERGWNKRAAHWQEYQAQAHESMREIMKD